MLSKFNFNLLRKSSPRLNVHSLNFVQRHVLSSTIATSQLGSIRTTKRLLSTNTAESSSSSSSNTTSSTSGGLVSLNIPSNLFINDLKIFEAAPVPIIKPIDYLFPIINVPESTPVVVFDQPGVFADTPALLNPDIFCVAIRKDIVLECIRYHRHKMRQPKKTKRMSEIAGSNKKPRPQKGTGSAQVGHKRNSAWRGGQKAHGPVIRDYSIGQNKKQRALGMMIAITAKFREGNLVVVDKLTLPTFKTKQLSSLLQEHKLFDRKTLFLDEDFDENFLRASQNMPMVRTHRQLHASVYAVINTDVLIITTEGFAKLQHRLMKQYTHQGRRSAYDRDLTDYEQMVEEGSSLPDLPESSTMHLPLRLK